MDNAILSLLSGLFGAIIGGAASLAGQSLAGRNAAILARHNAEASREHERERVATAAQHAREAETRSLAREQRALQLEARWRAEQLVRKSLFAKKGAQTEPVADEIAQVTRLLANAFGSSRFARDFDRLVLTDISMYLAVRDSEPPQDDLRSYAWKRFSVFDEEMWRVIDATAVTGGFVGLEKPRRIQATTGA